MKKKEFNELINRVINLVKADMDSKLQNSFESHLETKVRELPKHKEVIRTLKGIAGYHNYCGCEAHRKESGFVFNALHDLRECISNYTEAWFSPRLSRFADQA